MDTSSDPAASLYGDATKVIAFELYDIDSGTLKTATCRLELVDSITGEVLVPDVAQNFWQGIDSVYGTQTCSFLYSNQGDTEGQEATGSMESQLSPSPNPEFH